VVVFWPHSIAGRISVQYGLCTHVCIVVWLDSPTHKYLNTPPEAQHSQKEETETKGMTARKRNNNHPLELNIPKSDWPKHPKIPRRKLPSSKPRSNPNPAPTKFHTPILKPTTLQVTPITNIPPPWSQIGATGRDQQQQRSGSVTSRRDFPTIVSSIV